MADNVVDLFNRKVSKIFQGDLFLRSLSLLIFIPMILVLCFGSTKLFFLLCFAVVVEVTREILFSGDSRNLPLRLIFLAFCFSGIYAFACCRVVFGVPVCMFLLCLTTATDTGAYCVGKIFGGPKLCPKISPQKTWAGFFGGIVLANVAYFVIRSFFLKHHIINDSLISTIVNNSIIVQLMIFSAIVGDLFESFFKRRIGVKDIGRIFPGHGGVLDRFDSLIFLSIVFWLIAFFVES